MLWPGTGENEICRNITNLSYGLIRGPNVIALWRTSPGERYSIHPYPYLPCFKPHRMSTDPNSTLPRSGLSRGKLWKTYVGFCRLWKSHKTSHIRQRPNEFRPFKHRRSLTITLVIRQATGLEGFLNIRLSGVALAGVMTCEMPLQPPYVLHPLKKHQCIPPLLRLGSLWIYR